MKDDEAMKAMNIRVSFHPALVGGGSVWPEIASLFRYGSDYRKYLLFSVQEGGQTEWRWVCRGSLVNDETMRQPR